jgi:hypothetical protein
MMVVCSAINAANPKLCIHCKHFMKHNFFTNNEFGRCKKFIKYPRYNENYINFLVTGENKRYNIDDYYYCSTVRIDSEKCGTLGISYESKNNQET